MYLTFICERQAYPFHCIFLGEGGCTLHSLVNVQQIPVSLHIMREVVCTLLDFLHTLVSVYIMREVREYLTLIFLTSNIPRFFPHTPLLL